MSKRKITRKQAWRIEKVQEERVARAERKNAKIDAHENDGDLGPEQEGLVIAHYGTQVEVHLKLQQQFITQHGRRVNLL